MKIDQRDSNADFIKQFVVDNKTDEFLVAK